MYPLLAPGFFSASRHQPCEIGVKYEHYLDNRSCQSLQIYCDSRYSFVTCIGLCPYTRGCVDTPTHLDERSALLPFSGSVTSANRAHFLLERATAPIRRRCARRLRTPIRSGLTFSILNVLIGCNRVAHEFLARCNPCFLASLQLHASTAGLQGVILLANRRWLLQIRTEVLRQRRAQQNVATAASLLAHNRPWNRRVRVGAQPFTARSPDATAAQRKVHFSARRSLSETACVETAMPLEVVDSNGYLG
jgi:hypothetical protein